MLHWTSLAFILPNKYFSSLIYIQSNKCVYLTTEYKHPILEQAINTLLEVKLVLLDNHHCINIEHIHISIVSQQQQMTWMGFKFF